MSLKSEEDLKPKDLVFLLAIAGRIDAQSKLLAQKLDEDRYIYHAYAVIDSLSSSYSMFKYFFDVFIANGDPNLMHDVLASPEGIAAVTAEAIFLVSFSLLASLFEREEHDPVKKFISSAWPYFRDLMKGLKNAYKGWRSTVQMFSLISGNDLSYMVIPVGLVLGVFAAANRLWLRSMVERRKKQMDENKQLLIEIQQLSLLTSLDREHYLSKIGYQDEEECIHSFLAVAVGGFIDGLYLYIGVVSLSAFAPPLFIAMSTISAFYTLACIISRIYEEYDFQLRLIVTQTKCKFALVRKEMETTYAHLLSLLEKQDKNAHDLQEIKALKSELSGLIKKYDELRQLLKEQTTHSYLTAGLLGMKYGLFGYGALTSILFMVSGIFLVTATTFPPALLAAMIVSGIVLMLGFTLFSLRSHYLHLQKEKGEEAKEHPYSKLMEMKSNLENQNDAEILTADLFQESLKDGSNVKSSPQYYYQEWFEVFRAFASGVSKGNNFSTFVGTPFQDMDSDGHYHDAPIMGVLAIASAAIFAVILALRTLARGLGRPPKAVSVVATNASDGKESSTGHKDTRAFGESNEPVNKNESDSLPPKTKSSLSSLSFFNSSSDPYNTNSKTMIHSMSDNALSLLDTNSDTILGLD